MNILLLSDGSWDRTVRLAVASMCGAAVQQVRSFPAAVAQLTSYPPVSCIMVQAGRYSDQLRQLASVAGAGRKAPAEMIILGRDLAAPPNATMLPADVSTESLSRVLAAMEEGSTRQGSRALTDADVMAALDSSRLHTRYQPIVGIADGAPFALEVLARLDHPKLGNLQPSQFVPQIEHAGLARKLTELVIETTLADYRAHLSTLGMALALNFPLDVLMRQDLAGWLEHRCEQAGLSPDRVIIELTESQPVAFLDGQAHAHLHAAMRHMRRLGFRLALDDFGPDMPERQDLFKLPFDLLKLDKAVVNETANAPLVEQAVRAAKGRFQVIAEGVEDSATWKRMADLGVDYVQGFLVSRPVPAQNVTDWMDEWRGRLA